MSKEWFWKKCHFLGENTPFFPHCTELMPTNEIAKAFVRIINIFNVYNRMFQIFCGVSGKIHSVYLLTAYYEMILLGSIHPAGRNSVKCTWRGHLERLICNLNTEF